METVKRVAPEAVDLGRVVIVGAGASGTRFAQSLRTGGYAGPITMLGDELDPPYHRPLLSKEVLKSAREIEEILLCTPEELQAQDILFLPGTRVVAVDRDSKTVRLESGYGVEYDTLVLAIGVRPRVLGSAPLGGRVHSLHTAEECRGLRRALDSAETVAVVGGGFIGSEIAATVRELGRKVEMISATQYPMQESLGEWVGRRIGQMHVDHGVSLRMDAMVADLSQDDDGVRIDLADGSVVSADIAIIGIGSTPTTKWLDDSGLEIVDGIIVDPDGRTGDESIWAIGDVARRKSPDGSSVRVEHWTSATEQADALARRLMGKRPSPVPPLDYLWTDLYGTKIQMLGHVLPGSVEHVLLDEPDRFIVAYTLHDRLVSVVAQGVAGRFMKFRVPVAAGHGVEELRELAV